MSETTEPSQANGSNSSGHGKAGDICDLYKSVTFLGFLLNEIDKSQGEIENLYSIKDDLKSKINRVIKSRRRIGNKPEIKNSIRLKKKFVIINRPMIKRLRIKRGLKFLDEIIEKKAHEKLGWMIGAITEKRQEISKGLNAQRLVNEIMRLINPSEIIERFCDWEIFLFLGGLLSYIYKSQLEEYYKKALTYKEVLYGLRDRIEKEVTRFLFVKKCEETSYERKKILLELATVRRKVILPRVAKNGR